jgi:hypothetical protein
VATIVVPTANTVITSAWGKSVADALNTGFVQGGFKSGTTNASGELVIVYPFAFAAAPALIATEFHSVGGVIPATISVMGTGSSATQGTVKLARGGAPLASVGVTLYWIAIGARV